MADSENVLPRVPSQYLAAALGTLPNAEIAGQDVMEALIDVPDIGRVLVTAKRLKHKRGRSTNYFWTAEKAVVI